MTAGFATAGSLSRRTMKRRWSAPSCPAFAAPDIAVVVVDDGSDEPHAATSRCSQARSSSGIRSTSDRAPRCRPASTTPSSSRADALVTFDADGQHSPAAIAALLAAIEQPGIDFALGSRFLTGANRNLPVVAPHPAASAAPLVHAREHRTAGHRYHNGLRAMTARGARAISLRQNRMAHGVRDPAPDRAEPPALCRGAGEHRVQCLFAGQGSTHHRCADHPESDLFARRLYR